MKLTGKYLLSLGLAPGKVFGEVLRHFNGAEHSFTEEDVKEMYYSRAKEEERKWRKELEDIKRKLDED